ncbi:MAG: hypothetical protein ABI645_01670 [Pseudomonadota bacterium]
MNRCSVYRAALLVCAALVVSGRASADPRTSQTTGQEAGPPTPPDIWLRRLVGKYKFEGLVQVVALGDCGPLPPDPAKQDQISEAPPEPYCRSITGKGDCIAIGTGPGVQCILNVAWRDMYETVYQTATEGTVDNSPTGVFELPGGASYLDPSMALFGLGPGNPSITYLLVDHKGMPEGGPGSVSGNRATFKTECVNAATLLHAMKQVEFNNRMPHTCERTIYFDAKPDSKVVLVTMDIDINDDPFTRFTITMRRETQEDKKAVLPAKPASPAKPTSR